MVARGKSVSHDVNFAFANFLFEVEENWLQSPDKDPDSPLWEAYQIIKNKYGVS